MTTTPQWQEPREVRAQIEAARSAIRESLGALRAAAPGPAAGALTETPPRFPPMRQAVQRAAAQALLDERRGRLADHVDGRVRLDAREVRRLEDDVSRLSRFLLVEECLD